MDRPITIVIYGASGDLTHRKLMPALFNLFRKGRMPEDFHLVGFARSEISNESFRETMLQGVKEFGGNDVNPEQWEQFSARISYFMGSYSVPEYFDRLAKYLGEIEKGPVNRIYYLATPPDVFAQVANDLGRTGMVDESDGWRRLIVEKPFGIDLDSAKSLNQALQSVLAEKQIYRIDHYLGKETVQNLLVFRFANTIFEPVWNRNFIDNVQITVSEEVGVGHRAKFYDKVGVLRDMFQNHLLQLLALVAMEPPASYKADALRDERVKVLEALRPIAGEEIRTNCIQGQYEGYLSEDGVQAGSRTATYGAVRLFVDNWRWQGVPFYLRSGKALAEKLTEIRIQFKCPPHLMFQLPLDYQMTPNILVLQLQPKEGIHLRFEAKVPDTAAEMRSVDMDFFYRDAFGPNAIPDAYERLLLDAINGDASLFTRADQVELGWQFFDPIIKEYENEGAAIPVYIYPQGSEGPEETNGLIAWGEKGCRC